MFGRVLGVKPELTVYNPDDENQHEVLGLLRDVYGSAVLEIYRDLFTLRGEEEGHCSPMIHAKARRLIGICDYLEGINRRHEEKFDSPAIDTQEIEAMRSIAGDFTYHDRGSAKRRMGFFRGYSVKLPEAGGLEAVFDWDKLQESQRKLDEGVIPELKDRFGAREIGMNRDARLLLNHTTEMILTSFPRPKFGDRYHFYVAGRIVGETEDVPNDFGRILNDSGFFPECVFMGTENEMV